jgi:hypothetical protein
MTTTKHHYIAMRTDRASGRRTVVSGLDGQPLRYATLAEAGRAVRRWDSTERCAASYSVRMVTS